MGAYILGGWGKFRKGRSHKQTLDYLLEHSGSFKELKPDRLFHPIKCSADSAIGPRSLACVRAPTGEGCLEGSGLPRVPSHVQLKPVLLSVVDEVARKEM